MLKQVSLNLNQVSFKKGKSMSLDKSIEHGSEHRKEYRGSKAIDPTCRNHGSCKWCENNRLFKTKKEISKLDSEEEDYLNSNK